MDKKKMIIIGSMIGLIVIGGLIISKSSSKEEKVPPVTQEELNIGKKAEEEAKLVTARNSYEDLIISHSGDETLLVNLLNVYFNNGNYSQVYEVYEDLKEKKLEVSLQNKVNDIMNLTNKYCIISEDIKNLIGNSEDQSGSGIIKILEPYYKSNTEDVASGFYLAKTYFEQDRYTESKEILESIVNNEPRFIMASIMLIDVYENLGEYDKGILVADKVLTNNSESIDALALKAKIKLKQNELQEGSNLANKAYELDNENKNSCISILLSYHYNNMIVERDEMKNYCIDNQILNISEIESYESLFGN